MGSVRRKGYSVGIRSNWSFRPHCIAEWYWWGFPHRIQNSWCLRSLSAQSWLHESRLHFPKQCHSGIAPNALIVMWKVTSNFQSLTRCRFDPWNTPSTNDSLSAPSLTTPVHSAWWEVFSYSASCSFTTARMRKRKRRVNRTYSKSP
jgi:hypothetical protein